MKSREACSHYTAKSRLAEEVGRYRRAENLMRRALYSADLCYDNSSIVRQCILMDIALLNLVIDRREAAVAYKDEAIQLAIIKNVSDEGFKRQFEDALAESDSVNLYEQKNWQSRNPKHAVLIA